MNKPHDYEDVQAFTAFTPLAPGGHICRIVKVEEAVSRSNREMIVIYLDTDKTDKQPLFYSESFKNDNRKDKKWSNGAICRQLIFDSEGNTNRGLKTFIEAVENSNQGFKVQWGNNFANCFKNKLVGGVFGREEYLDNYGSSKFSTKIQQFRTIDDIKAGVEVPKDILLNPANKNNSDAYFPDYTPVTDENMPF